MDVGIGGGEVRDDAGDGFRIGDVRENAKWGPTAGASAEVETESAVQSLHPATGGGANGRCRRRIVGRGRLRWLGYDAMSLARVGGEHAVIAKQVDSRAGNEGGESGNEVQRLEQHMGGAIGERAFELVDDEAVAVDAQVLERDGGA